MQEHELLASSAGEELQALMGMNCRLWLGGQRSRCLHTFRKFRLSIQLVCLQAERRGLLAVLAGQPVTLNHFIICGSASGRAGAWIKPSRWLGKS